MCNGKCSCKEKSDPVEELIAAVYYTYKNHDADSDTGCNCRLCHAYRRYRMRTK